MLDLTEHGRGGVAGNEALEPRERGVIAGANGFQLALRVLTELGDTSR